MEPRTVQLDRQQSGESSEQRKTGSLCSLGLQSTRAASITRRTFFAAMIAVLAVEFREGWNRRNSSSSA